MAAQYEFQRKENKYLIHQSLADQLCNVCTHLMPTAEQRTYTIRSLYFDSQQWECFYDQVFKKLPRFKVRFRQYVESDNYFSKGFLEMKLKAGSCTVKQRFWVYPQWLSQLENPEVIDEILRLNIGNKNFPKVYRSITTVMREHQLRPVLQVHYQRISFEDSSLRLTLDRGLQFSKVSGNLFGASFQRESVDESFSVLEVKTMAEPPEWLEEFRQQYGIRKQSFSKYCFGVSLLYDPLLNHGVEENYYTEQNIGLLYASAS